MKRITALILALCLVLALTACSPAEFIKGKITEKLSEAIGQEKANAFFEGLAEGLAGEWKFGRLIYEESDTISTDENGEEISSHEEIRYGYDEDGNQILFEQTVTMGDGTTQTTRTESEYDENGNTVRETTTYEEGTSVTEYTYDSEGRMIRDVTTYSDGRQGSSTSEYDEEGRLTLSTYTGVEGDRSESRYVYDEYGNEIRSEWTNVDSDGTVSTAKTEMEYDENGNVVRTTDSYVEGKQSVMLYEYDAEGRRVKEIYTDEDGDTSTTEFSFDENGNETDEVYTGKYSSSTIHREFDENGNQLRSTYTDGEYRSESVNRYDDNGNVIYARNDTWDGEEHEFNISVYAYDDKDRCVSYNYYDSEGASETSSYDYDSYGYQIQSAETRINADGSLYYRVQRSEYDFGEPLG